MNFRMPDQLFAEETQPFSVERDGRIISEARGFFCGNDYPSTIQLVEDAKIRNGDWLIDTLTGHRYFVENARPISLSGQITDWMVKYQTETQLNQSRQVIHNSTFNIHSISGTSVIGNQENVTLHIGGSLSDFARLIGQLPVSEQEEGYQLLEELARFGCFSRKSANLDKAPLTKTGWRDFSVFSSSSRS